MPHFYSLHFAQYEVIFCTKLCCGVSFAQLLAVFCANLRWWSDFAQFGAVFCANLRWWSDFAQFGAVFCTNFRWWSDFELAELCLQCVSRVFYVHKEECIAGYGVTGGAAVFLGKHLFYPFRFPFAGAYFKQ